MKKYFTTKRLCRAGIIAALYVALTYAFGAIGYQGFVQIRPAEALTVLPLFYAEAAPALVIGCLLANLGSPFLVYDVPIGTAATLIAVTGTLLVGVFVRNHPLRLFLGGLFPVLVNAFIIPVIIVYLCGGVEPYATALTAYWAMFGSMCATQALWVYGLGAPLYFAVYRLKTRNIPAFV